MPAREPLLLRNSARGDFNRCPWLWYQHWVEGWTPDRSPTWSVFGSAMHKALEVRYPPGTKRGSLADAIDAFLDYLDGEVRKVGVDVFEEEYERAEERAAAADKEVTLIPAHELGPAMLRHYVEVYGEDEEWEVIHNEQPFQIDVPYPADWGARFAGQVLCVYCGTWDVLMRNRRTKRFFLWDWKTCKKLPDPAWLEMADQPGSYLWVGEEVLRHLGIFTAKDTLDGIIFQYLRKALKDQRPVNAHGETLNRPLKAHYLDALVGVDDWTEAELRKKKVEELADIAAANMIVVEGEVSKTQPAPRFLRYDSIRSPQQKVRQAKRVQESAVVMELMLSGEIPVNKHVTQECPRCILFDMCTAHESGDDWELLRDELYVVRDPYVDHREAMQHGGVELRKDRKNERTRRRPRNG